MNTKNLSLAAIIAVIVIGLVFAGVSITSKTKSAVEVTEKSVVNGTITESTTMREMTTNDDGDWTQETKTKTTIDPVGPMNKQTIEDETRTEEAH